MPLRRLRVVCIAVLVGGLLLAEPGTPQRAWASEGVEGTVVDAATGTPVAGAWVVPLREGERYVRTTRGARSDREGRFVLPAAAPEARTALYVVAPTFVPMRQALTKESSAARMALARGREVRGRVEDPLGNGVGGVRVWAHLPGVTFAWPHTDLCVEVRDRSCGAVAFSDADGSFLLRGLSPDTAYSVRAAALGWLALGTDDWPGSVPLGPQETNVRLNVVATAEVRVRTVDAESREPIGTLWGVSTSGEKAELAHPPPYAWLAPGMEGDLGWSPDRLRFVLAAYLPGKGRAGHGPASLSLTATGHGKNNDSLYIDLPESMGKVTEIEAPFERTAGLTWGHARFAARWVDGSPFTGVLMVVIEGVGSRSRHLLTFREGESAERRLLPQTKLRAQPGGTGPHGGGWTNAGPAVEFEPTEEPSATPVMLRLEGNPLSLDVRGPDGRIVRGYDLRLRPGHMQDDWDPEAWDTPGIAVEIEALDQDPYLWVHAGTNTVRVHHSEFEAAEGKIEAPGDGKALRLRVDLKLRAIPK
jgi:hypothetical protein